MPPPPPLTSKASRTRRRLIDIATDLFVERGYNAVSVPDIAAAAELTKGAVYGHFRTKGQLFVEVLRDRVARRDDEADFENLDLDRGIEMLYSPHRRDVRVLMVEAAAAARHDDDVAAGLEAFYDERLVQMRHAVAELPDPDTAAWLVGVLVDGIGLREAAGFQLPPEPELHAALRAVLLGLATDHG